MPIDLIRVLAVHPVRTVNPAVMQYLIDAETVEEHPRHMQYMTINELRAALCQQVAGTSSLLSVAWKDSRYRTKEIVTVELDGSAWLDQASS